LFWLTVSKVSIRGHLAPLLWACGKAEHLHRKGIVTQRRWEGPRRRHILERHLPSDLLPITKPQLIA
jgi:hypothetical protein